MASVQDALLVMTEGRLGLALVGNRDKLSGVITLLWQTEQLHNRPEELAIPF